MSIDITLVLIEELGVRVFSALVAEVLDLDTMEDPNTVICDEVVPWLIILVCKMLLDPDMLSIVEVPDKLILSDVLDI